MPNAAGGKQQPPPLQRGRNRNGRRQSVVARFADCEKEAAQRLENKKQELLAAERLEASFSPQISKRAKEQQPSGPLLSRLYRPVQSPRRGGGESEPLAITPEARAKRSNARPSQATLDFIQRQEEDALKRRQRAQSTPRKEEPPPGKKPAWNNEKSPGSYRIIRHPSKVSVKDPEPLRVPLPAEKEVWISRTKSEDGKVKVKLMAPGSAGFVSPHNDADIADRLQMLGDQRDARRQAAREAARLQAVATLRDGPEIPEASKTLAANSTGPLAWNGSTLTR